MSDGIEKKCKVCGTQYKVCHSCEKNKSWRVHTDTLEHFYIFGVLMEYQVNHDAHKAFDALSKRNFDFFNVDEYLPNVQDLLKEIYTLTHENSRAKKKGVASSKSFDPANIELADMELEG